MGQDTEVFFNEAEGFFQRAVSSRKRPEIFTPEILYYLAAMAMEKYFSAFLASRGTLAQHHTMQAMLSMVQEYENSASGLTDDMIFMDSFHDLCGLNPSSGKKPGDEHVSLIMESMGRVRDWVIDHLRD